MLHKLFKLFKLFKINRCSQCGKKYLQLFGIYQWCSKECRYKEYAEFDEESEIYK